METLKFLMVSTHYPPYHLGGDAVFVEYLAQELTNRGHEVHVLYNPSVFEVLRGSHPKPAVSTSSRQVARHELSSRHPRRSLYTSLVTGSCKRAEDALVRLCKELKPDVLHWHNTKGFIGVPHSVKGITSLFTAHDYYMVCPRSNLTRPDMSFCEDPRYCQICLVRWRKPIQAWRVGKRRVIRLDKELRVICPSEYTAARLRADGIEVSAILRNFVPDPGTRVCQDTRARDRIVYVGMLEPHKGPMTLLDAFVRSSGGHDLKLSIIGNGSMREKLVASAGASPVAGRIDIPGFVPRDVLQKTLCNAAALVIPSEWPENAPLVALEALATGVPIIGTDQGGLPEILSRDAGCRMYPSGNTDALKDQILSTWNERDQLSSLGQKARKEYETRFSPETHVEAYLQLIKKNPVTTRS